MAFPIRLVVKNECNYDKLINVGVRLTHLLPLRPSPGPRQFPAKKATGRKQLYTHVKMRQGTVPMRSLAKTNPGALSAPSALESCLPMASAICRAWVEFRCFSVRGYFRVDRLEIRCQQLERPDGSIDKPLCNSLRLNS